MMYDVYWSYNITFININSIQQLFTGWYNNWQLFLGFRFSIGHLWSLYIGPSHIITHCPLDISPLPSVTQSPLATIPGLRPSSLSADSMHKKSDLFLTFTHVYQIILYWAEFINLGMVKQRLVFEFRFHLMLNHQARWQGEILSLN